MLTPSRVSALRHPARRRSQAATNSTPGASSAHHPGKRIFDLAMLILVALPALALGSVCALAILLTDGSPVLFRQARAGRGGQPFILLKLRTMTAAGPSDDVPPDSARITRVGAILRRLSADELPQLINVLRGEMSLVGPRPTLPYQVRRYDSRQFGRLSVRPGMTGLAQVKGRSQMSWAERIEWDLRYAENQSPWLDLKIIVLTFWTVMRGEGVTIDVGADPIAQVRKDGS